MVEPAPGEIRQEQRRELDTTILEDDDSELQEELEFDSYAEIYKGDKEPKVMITSSGDNEAAVLPFGKCLEELIPNSEYRERIACPFSAVREGAISEGFTDLLVLVEAKGNTHTMMHLHLPYGPSAHWRVTSIVLPKDIKGHARMSSHYPEVIMQRFETRLGKLCSRMLRALFPMNPDFVGRQVCTFHHQRDFIFFRQYRYIFDSTSEARTQESGPRFTLKLLWLQEGPFDPSNGQYTFYRRQRHEISRRKWWL